MRGNNVTFQVRATGDIMQQRCPSVCLSVVCLFLLYVVASTTERIQQLHSKGSGHRAYAAATTKGVTDVSLCEKLSLCEIYASRCISCFSCAYVCNAVGHLQYYCVAC